MAAADIDTAGAAGTATVITTRGGRAIAGHHGRDPARERDGGHVQVETFGSGRLDVLVNNAGVNVLKPTDAITAEEWNRVFAVERAPARSYARSMPRANAPHRGGRGIINIASIFGLVGPVLHAATPYAASKGAVLSMTRALAIEWADDGIRVNAVAPTYVRTEMTRARVDDPDHQALMLDRTPLRRILEPTDLAGALLFLASAASEFVTGHVLAVDAGWLAA